MKRILSDRKHIMGSVYVILLLCVSLLCVFSRGSDGMAEGEEAMSQEDWKEKCIVLEALLMKFRVQIIKIRELTADKVGSSILFSVNLRPQQDWIYGAYTSTIIRRQ